MVQEPHPVHLRIIEKVGQFESSAGVAFRALQLLSDSRFIADHASDGSWDHGPCLELGGIDRIRT
jgi:hypothetical protein